MPSFCTGRIRIHLVLNCETVIRTETHLCWRMWACALKTGPTTAKTKQYISTQPKITVTFSTVSSLPDKNMGRYNSQVPTRMTHIPKKKRPPSPYFRCGPRSGVQGREHCHATLNPMGFVDVADDFDRHHKIRGMTWAPKHRGTAETRPMWEN